MTKMRSANALAEKLKLEIVPLYCGRSKPQEYQVRNPALMLPTIFKSRRLKDAVVFLQSIQSGNESGCKL